MYRMPIRILVSCLIGITVGNAFGAIIYVDTEAAGDNNGSSWTNAYTELQSAFSIAQSGDEIWVAEGIYKPDQYSTNPAGTGNRNESFQLINGVTVYGGFDPTDGDISLVDRNWKKNPSILSGDIGTSNINSDNAYHVLYHPTGTNLDNTAILDGFFITYGNANGGAYPHFNGGGVFNRESSPTFRYCSFEGNSASGTGGGMYNQISNPELINCVFRDNSSEQGGGIYNYDASPTLTDCHFINNSSITNGAGMYNYSPTTSEPILEKCSFIGNDGFTTMFNNQSSPSLTNCLFGSNNGTGMHNFNSSPICMNCTFSANTGNTAGGIFNQNSFPQLTNCILWGNLPTEINESINSTPVITYSNIKGGYTGEGNINSDPEFGKLGFYLTNISPCIDMGTSGGAPIQDIDGELRPNGSGIDMGADEFYGICEVGDLDCDGDVDGADLADFAGVYGL